MIGLRVDTSDDAVFNHKGISKNKNHMRPKMSSDDQQNNCNHTMHHRKHSHPTNYIFIEMWFNMILQLIMW